MSLATIPFMQSYRNISSNMLRMAAGTTNRDDKIFFRHQQQASDHVTIEPRTQDFTVFTVKTTGLYHITLSDSQPYSRLRIVKRQAAVTRHVMPVYTMGPSQGSHYVTFPSNSEYEDTVLNVAHNVCSMTALLSEGDSLYCTKSTERGLNYDRADTTFEITYMSSNDRMNYEPEESIQDLKDRIAELEEENRKLHFMYGEN